VRRPAGSCGDRARALAGIGREGGDIDEAHNIGVITGLGDHGTAIGMSNQEDRLPLLGDHLAGALSIIGKRSQRILHGHH